jgi:hypothetical protein
MRTREITRFRNVPREPGKYVYRIKSTGHSSMRYGPCEVCKKGCSEVFYQVEGLTYCTDELDDCGPGKICVTYHECRNLFGHEDCLRGARR